MNHEQCPTVRIKTPITDDNQTGYIVINESDLDEDMELFTEDGEQSAAKTEPKVETDAALKPWQITQ